METKKYCINCGTQLIGNFCHTCGQKSHVKRISIKNFFEDYVSRLFGMDTNFLRTLRDLTFAPGKVGNTFVNGNRVKYIGPVGYFFLINTFFILTFSLLDIDIKTFLTLSSERIVNAPTLGAKDEALRSSLMGIVSNNLKVLEFLIIPFIALWARAFYKKSKLNFFEHSVNALYVQGHMVFLKITGVFLYKFAGFILNPYLIFINLLYFIWSCFGFYNVKGIKNIFKSTFLFILSFASFILFVVITTIVGVALFRRITGT